MKMLRRVWKDEAGFVVSTELTLVATILAIGMVVGLATVRNALVQEFGDVAMSVGRTNQSFQYSGVAGREASSATAGSLFQDNQDFCDDIGRDPIDDEPAGISVQRGPISEGTALPTS